MVEQKSDSEKMSSQAAGVGFFTFLSRLMGLARDSLIAYFLGTKAAADAFYVAFRIPNLLRRLLAEGSLTISFVPVFTELLKKDKDEAKRLTSGVFTLLSLLLVVVSLLGVLFSSSLVFLTAMGFRSDPQKYQLTILLTRIMFPYILLVSLAALAMGVLNSLKRFAAPAAAPIFMNVGIIIAAILLRKHFSHPTIALACGVLLGGVMQIGVQVPSLYRLGYFPKILWIPQHEYVRKVFKLMIPAIYGSAIYQINVLINTSMASFLGSGPVSYLWYADRIMEFPLGVFAVSFATVILPRLAEHAADAESEKFKKTFLSGLRMIYFINIPAMLGLIALSKLIITVLFQHGQFNQLSTYYTSRALICQALALPFISGTRVTAAAFYALQDTKSPVRAANLAIVVNIITGACLLHFLGYLALSLASATAAVFNFFTSYL